MVELNDNMRQFLSGRRIAALATLNPKNIPHLTAIWYLFENDVFYIGVSSKSRKWKNIAQNPNVSIMVESRVSAKERGITAMGIAELITGESAKQWVRKIHERYLTPSALADPKVGGVYAEGDDGAIKITPHKWLSWDIAEHDAKNLDGRLSNRNYTYPLDI